jgi:hypothetical protein
MPFFWQTIWMKLKNHWWLVDHALEFLFNRNSIWRYQMALDGFQWKSFMPYAPFLPPDGTCLLLLPTPLSLSSLSCLSLLFPMVTSILSRDLNSYKIGVWLAIQNSISVGSCWGSMFMVLCFWEDDYAFWVCVFAAPRVVLCLVMFKELFIYCNFLWHLVCCFKIVSFRSWSHTMLIHKQSKVHFW